MYTVCVTLELHWDCDSREEASKSRFFSFFVLECGTLYLYVLCHSVSDEAQRSVLILKKKKKSACEGGKKKKSPLLNPVIDLLGHLCVSSLLSRIFYFAK